MVSIDEINKGQHMIVNWVGNIRELIRAANSPDRSDPHLEVMINHL